MIDSVQLMARVRELEKGLGDLLAFDLCCKWQPGQTASGGFPEAVRAARQLLDVRD